MIVSETLLKVNDEIFVVVLLGQRQVDHIKLLKQPFILIALLAGISCLVPSGDHIVNHRKLSRLISLHVLLKQHSITLLEGIIDAHSLRRINSVGFLVNHV